MTLQYFVQITRVDGCGDALKQQSDDIRPGFNAHYSFHICDGRLRSEQEAMSDARQVDKHLHPIVDEMRNSEAFADWRLVATLPAEVERLRIKAKRVEQLMLSEPEAGLLLCPR